jgi:hypothetical protein
MSRRSERFQFRCFEVLAWMMNKPVYLLCYNKNEDPRLKREDLC